MECKETIPYKGLRMRFGEFIIQKIRTTSRINSLSHQMVNGQLFNNWVKATYTPILMEWWEFVARLKIERELPNQLYRIGSGRYVATTGKRGYIEFEIALQKEERKFCNQEMLDALDEKLKSIKYE